MRAVWLGLALVVTAAPLSAQDAADSEALERGVRTCLSNGAPGAPRDSLLAAVVALRSLCATPIIRLRASRLQAVDAGYGPEADLTPSQREDRERARDTAARQLNDEVAYAVSNFTGLTL